MSYAELKIEIGQLMAAVKLLCSPGAPSDIKEQIANCLSSDLCSIIDYKKLDEIIHDNMRILTSEQKPKGGI